MRDFAVRHPFWAFYIVAISFPSLLFVYLTIAEGLSRSMGGPDASLFMEFVRTREALHQAHPILTQHQDGLPTVIALYALVPFAFPFLFFPFAPTVSAIWILWLSRGKSAVLKLLSLYRPIHGSLSAAEGARIYATLLAFITLGIAAGLAYSAMFGKPAESARYAAAFGVFDWRLFLSGWIVALFLNQGGLLEELGWRGYALPLFIRYFTSPFRAALVLGVVWAMWHSPRDVWMIATGQQTFSELFHFLAMFIPSCIGVTIVSTYFVNITGGSVLPAIMLHGVSNYLGQIYSSGNTGVRAVVEPEFAVTFVCGALAVLILVGPDLGWKRRREIHGGDGSTDPSRAWVD